MNGHAAAASVILPPRSLLVFRGDAYTQCLHGIDAVEAESIDGSVANAEQFGLQIGDTLPRTGPRISLTIRRVLFTYKLNIKL